jgi:hypothetical protein
MVDSKGSGSRLQQHTMPAGLTPMNSGLVTADLSNVLTNLSSNNTGVDGFSSYSYDAATVNINDIYM